MLSFKNLRTDRVYAAGKNSPTKEECNKAFIRWFCGYADEPRGSHEWLIGYNIAGGLDAGWIKIIEHEEVL